MRFSLFSSAFVAAIVGFGGTLALLIAAAQAVGATPEQTASWVTAISLAKAAETLILSWRYRMPIVTAWSTAGLALVGASAGYALSDAVGAFIVAAVLLIATGLFRPITGLVERIPPGISAGMLAGILFPFVLAAAKVAGLEPVFILPLAALFFLIRAFNPPLAVIAVLVAGIAWSVIGSTQVRFDLELSTLVFVAPEFSFAAALGLGVPIYLVTMASQNLPGIAVLRADGYNPPAGPLFATTGFFSLLSAFFAASTTNLAAITAAICTGPDAHPDREKRWLVAFPYAGCWIIFAIFGASFAGLFTTLPPALIAFVAGVGLLSPFANAASIALKSEAERIPAVATFAITASGIAFFGVGAAFWGLVAGLGILGLDRMARRNRS